MVRKAVAIAAATKIQALVRGHQDRKKVDAYLTQLIEQLMSSTETRNKANGGGYNDDHDSMVEEEIIVLIDDDDGHDSDHEETVIEIVTIVDSKPAKPPPPASVSAFDRYNQQQQQQHVTASMAPAARTAKVLNKPVPAPAPAEPEQKPSIPTWKQKAAASKKSSTTTAPSNSSTNQQLQSPPKPKHKGALVNRYLEAAAKQDEIEAKSTDVSKIDKEVLENSEHKLSKEEQHRNAAQIEADRAKGRWKGMANSKNNSTRAIKTEATPLRPWEKKKLEKKLAPSPSQQSPKSFDEGAVVKLQALVRGMLARRMAIELVMSLLDELVHKKTTGKIATTTSKETSDTKMSSSSSSAPLEEEYDESKGLPLWWMNLVPHYTKDKDEYEREIKEDPNGANAIAYLCQSGQNKRKNKNNQKNKTKSNQVLPVITENDDYDGNGNVNGNAPEKTGMVDLAITPSSSGNSYSETSSRKKKRRFSWKRFLELFTRRKSEPKKKDNGVVDKALPVATTEHKVALHGSGSNNNPPISEDGSNFVLFEDHTDDENIGPDDDDSDSDEDGDKNVVDRVPDPESSEASSSGVAVTTFVLEHSFTTDMKIVVK